jgi:hypothetical protein
MKKSKHPKPQRPTIFELFITAKRAMELGVLTTDEGKQLQLYAMHDGERTPLNAADRRAYGKLVARVRDVLSMSEREAVDDIVRALEGNDEAKQTNN